MKKFHIASLKGSLNLREKMISNQSTSAPVFASRIIIGLAAVLVVLILVASWVPDSKMTELGWLPRWIGQLADRDPNFRTAIPFVPLVAMAALGFGGCGIKRPLVVAIVLGAVLLGLSEFGQVFLSARSADWRDLLWGGAGIAAGAGVAWGVRKWRGCEHRTSNVQH